MNEEEKNAVEYLKIRLYGNEGCKSIDVAQEDLRIFINLIDRKEKDIEGWKKHCEEIEEEQTETSNKNCELEFKVEKLQRENEKLKNQETTARKINELLVQRYSNSIPVQKIKDEIDRIDYDIKKTKEIISNNSNIYASDRRNDYQIVRLRAMNTKSLDIKKRLQELIEEREEK